MKNILLLTLVFISFVSFGKCKKKCGKKTTSSTTQTTPSPDEAWMRFDETKCANPWQFNWFAAPTDEQLAGAVTGNLQGREIHILEMRTKRDKDMVSCDACTCLNGFHYFARVPKEDIPKLKELKFVETKDIPAAGSNAK